MGKTPPSLDAWLREAKAGASAANCGMYLTHNGTVRATARALVRQGAEGTRPVTGMEFGFDRAKTAQAVEACRNREGVYYVRVWLNEGRLEPGDDIMFVLVGGDIRPHVADALQALVDTLKSECVTERELFD